MKKFTCILWIMLGAACTLAAQQTPCMPGMDMPPPQAKPATPHPSVPPAPDMRGMEHDHANPRAQRAGQSEQQSIQQQASQGTSKPVPGSDAASITVPIQELQEPEAVGFHTGGDLPAPELLGEVMGREPLTLESFVTSAEKSNPTLAEAQRNVDRSNAQARQLGLAPNPTVGYSGDHIRGGSYHGGEQGAFVSQVFVLGHKLALRRKLYLAEGKADEYAVEAQRARVHDDVARSFFGTLAAQETVVVQERLLKVALDAETNAHELERVGQADAADVLSAEIAAEQAKVEFEQAQRMFLASFAELAASSGQESLRAHPLIGLLVGPPQLDAESMVLTDTEESPAVKMAESGVEVANARLRDAKRERVPNLSVKAGEWYSGEDLGSTNRKTGWESFAEAGVQLPLWNHNQGNTEAAKAQLERARGEVARMQLWTRHQAEPVAQQYMTARSTAERYRTEMLPRARRAYQLEVTKYQQMAQSYPHVLAAQHMLFTLQLGYIEALDREWKAAIALENYALTNGLEAPVDAGEDNTTMNLPTANNP